MKYDRKSSTDPEIEPWVCATYAAALTVSATLSTQSPNKSCICVIYMRVSQAGVPFTIQIREELKCNLIII